MYVLQGSDWEHQAECFRLSADMAVYAILFEQRCGKSRVIVRTGVHLFQLHEIDAIGILAPNGVHRNWITDEFPKHAPLDLPWKGLIWRSNKAKQVGYQRQMAELLEFSGLPILAMNIEAIIHDSAKAFLKKFLVQRRCLLAIDESDTIADPGAKRTKTARAAGRYAPYRRILTGTPAAEGPLDLFSQFAFLDTSILGFTSYYAFRARYAKFEEGYDPRTGRTFPKLAGYLNVEELAGKMAPYSMRVTRAEISDAPPKIYAKRYFSLSEKQRAVYTELREKFIVELSDGQITAANVLARYTRLQQITSNIAVLDATAIECPQCITHTGQVEETCPVCEGLGFTVPTIDTRSVRVGDANPRLETLITDVKTTSGQNIVWCRFNLDVDDVMAALRSIGRKPVQYDGRVGEDDRTRNKQKFVSGEASDFIGKTSSGGRGLDLSCASNVYNYSHYFSLRLRLQGEDRAEGVMKKFSTAIIDLIAEETVDERIVPALREKKSLADLIVGDDPKEWI